MRTNSLGPLLACSLALACTGEITDAYEDPILPPNLPVDPLHNPQNCEGVDPDAEPGRWRRLTQRQYQNAVRDTFGVTVDASGFLDDTRPGESPFAANVAVNIQAQDVDSYWNSAETIATAVDVEAALGCAPSDEACVRAFIARTGRRAYRRTLSEPEVESLMTLYRLGAEEDDATGVRTVVQAMAQSPHFLYVEEYGYEGDAPAGAVNETTYPLDGFAVATRLSILLWNTTPDEALLDAAAAGELDAPAGIEAAADRLMADPRFMDTLIDFHMELSLAHPLDEISRAETEFTPELQEAMREDVARYVRQVMDAEGTVAALFQSPVQTDSPGLETVYGDNPGVRQGILTLPGVLASSPPIESNFVPTYRGNAIRIRFLCDPTPPPVIAIEFSGGADRTARERLREHKDNPGCSSCHSKMDPVGFPLENYDDLGRWRDEAQGEAVDATGEILLSRPSGIEREAVDGPVNLGEVLGGLEEVRACFATQWFRYALARTPGQRDTCSLQPVLDTLLQDGGDIRAAVRRLATSDAFRLRRGD